MSAQACSHTQVGHDPGPLSSALGILRSAAVRSARQNGNEANGMICPKKEGDGMPELGRFRGIIVRMIYEDFG